MQPAIMMGTVGGASKHSGMQTGASPDAAHRAALLVFAVGGRRAARVAAGPRMRSSESADPGPYVDRGPYGGIIFRTGGRTRMPTGAFVCAEQCLAHFCRGRGSPRLETSVHCISGVADSEKTREGGGGRGAPAHSGGLDETARCGRRALAVSPSRIGMAEVRSGWVYTPASTGGGPRPAVSLRCGRPATDWARPTRTRGHATGVGSTGPQARAAPLARHRLAGSGRIWDRTDDGGDLARLA